jgi:hypothetical protein
MPRDGAKRQGEVDPKPLRGGAICSDRLAITR